LILFSWPQINQSTKLNQKKFDEMQKSLDQNDLSFQRLKKLTKKAKSK